MRANARPVPATQKAPSPLRFAGAVHVLALAALLPFAPRARAQVVNDGATNTLNNVTNTFAGDVTVGTNAPFTFLLLTNGAFLTNSGNGAIGFGAAARSNTMWLTGTNTRWRLAGDVYVGSNGSWNRLIVSNGATVANNVGYLGLDAASSNNLAVVTGAGSRWSNASELYVGAFGSGNRLVVSNGGVVQSSVGRLGQFATSSNNVAVVTGAGSLWSNTSFLYVGNSGSSNQLVVSNGGVVQSSSGYLGSQSNSANNVAVVTGVGSLWNNAGLIVGGSGAGNQLVVSGGGVVQSSSLSDIGQFATSSNNLAVVTGAGSRWSNANVLFLGDSGSGNRLAVSNGGVVQTTEGNLGYFISSSNNVALVTAPGSLWSNLGNLFVGRNGSGNQLVVSNGGVVWIGGGSTLGNSSDSASNLAMVTGVGSLWDNDQIKVGGTGSGNRLVVSSGGRVRSSTGVVGASGSNNVAVVTGAGSVWSNANNLYVGDSGSGNQLVVSNGGAVQSSLGYVGHNLGSSSNMALVTGPGSLWSNVAELFVGFDGSGNQLVVSNGGVVANSAGYLAFNSNSANNVAVVTGAGSLWSNASGLYVGYLGSGNQLVVSNGGRVSSGFGAYLGTETNSINNRIITDGGTLRVAYIAGTGVFDIRRGTNVLNAGTNDVDQLLMTNAAGIFEFNGGTLITRGGFIDNGAPFVVGASGTNPAIWDVRASTAFTPSNMVVASNLVIGLNVPNSRLLLTNGQTLQVRGSTSTLGANAAASNTLALVAGAGSYWSNASLLNIGADGSFNALIISNGGVVQSSLGRLGINAPSSNNAALVTGAGSLWNNAGDLTVGFSGSGNRLVVSNGGKVLSLTGYLGFGVGSNNVAVVTGAGSLWSNVNELRVGFNGPGNQLVVSNGGVVQNTLTGYLGYTVTSSNNMAVVTGTGSAWNNAGDLFVGRFGSGNQLVVSNGGAVRSANGYLGHQPGANSNVAVVTGTGSVWSNDTGLIVGLSGSGNQLVVSNGGAVQDLTGAISGSNNVAVVTGAGSVWSNASSLSVGSGFGNQLVVSNGGTVFADFAATLGSALTATNNRLITDGGTLRVANGGVSGVFNLLRGTNVLNAGTNDVDQLVMTNTQGFFEFNGGRLITRGATISNGQDFVVGANAGFAPATWDVRSNAATTTVAGSLVIGSNAAGSRLLLTNGARLLSALGTLGFNTTSSNHAATVSGAGSFWTNSGDVTIGLNGSFNTLTVSNGGTVAGAGGVLGRFSTSRNNQAIVTGAGSLWSNSGTLFVGSNGSFNTLLVSGAGTVISTSGRIGFGSSANSNVATVTGSNSAWNILSNLTVGRIGVANQLIVSNGGFVRNVGAQIGDQSSASNNLVIVTGPGSVWTNSGVLSVGSAASTANEVLVTNSGALFSGGSSSIGPLTDRNRVTVTGPGSSWSNAGLLSLGQDSAGNELLISDGGTVTTGDAYVGRFTDGTNRAVVSGSGATWNVLGALRVGADGASMGNQLIVSNGGTVSAMNVSVGFNSSSTNNRVTVDGGTMRVTNAGGTAALDIRGGTNVLNAGLIVADRLLLTNSAGFFEFNGGTLITRGATISNGVDFIVGLNAGFTNATWDVRSNATPTTVADFLYIGNTASNARLLITNGATLNGSLAFIGANPGGNSNAAIVSGPNSAWLNTGELDVGANGTFNTLLVTNGGRVANGTGYIGGFSNFNAATVNGSNSTWSNSGSLSVGVNGSFNSLLVTNGGTAFASGTGLIVGAGNSSSNNRVTVDGGTLRVTNGSSTAALEVRRGTNVLNAGLIEADRLVVNNTLGLFESNKAGFFTFNGGTLNVRTSAVNNGAVFTVGNGTSAATYRMSGVATDGHSFANGLLIASNATLTGNGTITGTVTNFGAISAGSSAGSIKINGDLRLQSSSMMVFEIGGLIPTNQYDQVTVTNFAEFAGTLSLSLLNNFLPAPANTFTLVSFGSSSGSFTNISGGRVSLTNNLASFAVTQTATNLILGGVTYTDTDGDGQGDLQEIAAGTDPASQASEMRITALTRNASGHSLVQFESVVGKNYRIEYSNDLITWSVATTAVPAAGVGNSTQWIDDGSLTGGLPGTKRFYRIGLQ